MKQWDQIYNPRTEQTQVAEPELYRALLLLAGIDYTQEHLIPHMRTPYTDNPVYCQPALMVMTEWGLFKVGWRKSVINIEWKSSNYPDILIEPPQSYITHGEGYIHCYGYGQALDALQKLTLQFERHVYYDSLAEPKKSEKIARLKASEADEKQHKDAYELDQARKLVAEADTKLADQVVDGQLKKLAGVPNSTEEA